MFLFQSRFWRGIGVALMMATGVVMPSASHAAWGIIDNLNLAPFVPHVLDAVMSVATGTYNFFVGHGAGIVSILIYGFVGFSIGLYLVKMYFPKSWLSFFGFSGGGEMWDGKATGTTIVENVLKPVFRGTIAILVLLQIRPVFMTQWLVNPFLELGALYTNQISRTIDTGNAPQIDCPPSVVQQEWISADSCRFLTQPVSNVSHANNQMIKRGFELLNSGMRGLFTLIPHGGQDFMNILSGIFIIVAFVGCNLFMALLIIQAIFGFGMALALYPFSVLTWVAKPKNPDAWFDIYPAFANVISALQKLVITMIACAFILCINVAITRALFQWNSAVFVAGASGIAIGNVPTAAPDMGFGDHSILWLSSILTFYLMFQIFNRTQKQLEKYAPGMDTLYKNVKSDTKGMYANIKKLGQVFKKK